MRATRRNVITWRPVGLDVLPSSVVLTRLLTSRVVSTGFRGSGEQGVWETEVGSRGRAPGGGGSVGDAPKRS